MATSFLYADLSLHNAPIFFKMSFSLIMHSILLLHIPMISIILKKNYVKNLISIIVEIWRGFILMFLLLLFQFIGNVGFFLFPLIFLLLELRTIPLTVSIFLAVKELDFGHISFTLSLWTKIAKFPFSLGHSSKCLLP